MLVDVEIEQRIISNFSFKYYNLKITNTFLHVLLKAYMFLLTKNMHNIDNST